VNIEVLSTKEIAKLSYHVMGKGKLVDSQTVNFDNSKRHVLNITPKVSMVPKARVIVYYLTANGEIISDKIDVEFGNELSNFVDLKLSSEQAKPGETLNISVSTRSNSYVGLLGVDQSVLLLKKGNDIEPSTVFSELDKYGEVDNYNYEWYRNYDYSYDETDFSQSDAVLITNAKKSKGLSR
jgi:CD109 antigen